MIQVFWVFSALCRGTHYLAIKLFVSELNFNKEKNSHDSLVKISTLSYSLFFKANREVLYGIKEVQETGIITSWLLFS